MGGGGNRGLCVSGPACALDFDSACRKETDPSPNLTRRGIGHVTGELLQRPRKGSERFVSVAAGYSLGLQDPDLDKWWEASQYSITHKMG